MAIHRAKGMVSQKHAFDFKQKKMPVNCRMGVRICFSGLLQAGQTGAFKTVVSGAEPHKAVK